MAIEVVNTKHQRLRMTVALEMCCHFRRWQLLLLPSDGFNHA